MGKAEASGPGAPARYFDGKAAGAARKARTQAERIVAAFGGVAALVAALARVGRGVPLTTAYRWVYPYRSGLIPARYVHDITRAAVALGIELTEADWSPVVRAAGGGKKGSKS